ncbi:endonuclease/exonuclease/phosphatase family protein [Streptomyces thermovulgaris]|uniref:endonuclease/exonuclease/phosphatase family protein n=1 Tax=Streptomyces thermovulgaris TaxID=1934 RepID=UPI00130257E6|nr:endonuclease/exonuclease/phosphatase family protein [Streptomyces thermovulgaris]
MYNPLIIRSSQSVHAWSAEILRRTLGLGALFNLLLTLITLSGAPSALAGDILTEKSAGRKYKIESKAASAEAGKPICVSAEIHDSGNQYGKLRARTDCNDIGSWETFALHTNDKGETATLRSEANGLYVSAEFHDSGSHFGMLRARKGDGIGNWEKFEIVPQGGGWFALRYTFSEGGTTTKYYVSAEINSTGSDEGLLRARKTGTPGSWELFKLHRIDSEGVPPAASSTPSRNIRALSWNVCSNNGSCPMYGKTTEEFVDEVVTQAEKARADIIFLQEFCEKLAKPLEQGLEKKFDNGADTWDVRFAPIQHEIDGTGAEDGGNGLYAQKACAKNRGAYGVAIAVPAENTWYRAIELESPRRKDENESRKERRTALCAAIQSWAVMGCTAHFSTGGPGYEDRDRKFQAQQAQFLVNKGVEYGNKGYRSLFGGDLNATPTHTPTGSEVPVLQPLYDNYTECDQPRNRATKGSLKLDYIFAPTSATWSGCTIGTDTSTSDHWPIRGTVTLPAR